MPSLASSSLRVISMRLPDAPDAWTFSARFRRFFGAFSARGKGVWACGSGLCGGVPEAARTEVGIHAASVIPSA
eukprot:203857-Chlamydomonas_euryale.AAC.1